MKAVGFTRPRPTADPESLIDLDLPRPEPGGRDLLVEVRAVSVNPVDVKVRTGKAPAQARVLGWDAAGVVAGVGSSVSLFAPGDHVYFAGDLTRPGSNSEFCLVDERITGAKPASLDFAEAAALPLTTITAYEGLFERLRLPRGEAARGRSLLVVGGAGGVGSIAIQLAKVLSSATVIATASRPESAAWVRKLGADQIVDHSQPIAPQLAALGFPQVDHVLCTADTDPYFATLAALLAPQGSICFLVTAKQPVDLAPLHTRSITVTMELMFTRSMFQTADMLEQHRLLGEVSGLIDAGRIRTTLRQRVGPICARTLRAAHAQLETHATIGKLVVEGWS